MPHMDQPHQPYVKPDGSIGVKPAIFDGDGNLVPDPSWVAYLKEYTRGKPEEEKILEGPIPMLLNLGDDFVAGASAVGWATVYEESTGGKRIVITMDEHTSNRLGSLIEVFKLMGIGFAGVKRTSEGGS